MTRLLQSRTSLSPLPQTVPLFFVPLCCGVSCFAESHNGKNKAGDSGASRGTIFVTTNRTQFGRCFVIAERDSRHACRRTNSSDSIPCEFLPRRRRVESSKGRIDVQIISFRVSAFASFHLALSFLLRVANRISS